MWKYVEYSVFSIIHWKCRSRDARGSQLRMTRLKLHIPQASHRGSFLSQLNSHVSRG